MCPDQFVSDLRKLGLKSKLECFLLKSKENLIINKNFCSVVSQTFLILLGHAVYKDT